MAPLAAPLATAAPFTVTLAPASLSVGVTVMLVTALATPAAYASGLRGEGRGQDRAGGQRQAAQGRIVSGRAGDGVTV